MTQHVVELALKDVAKAYKGINDFRAMLNQKPNDKDLQENKFVKSKEPVMYLPIDLVYNELDTAFSGLWNLEITLVKIIVNEILVTVSLEVFHPIARCWLKRHGIGAVQIRMKSESDITDINNKIKNAVTADAPHALSEAVKNAAKKYGRRFGGSLNRKDSWLKFESIESIVVEDVVADEVVESILMTAASDEAKKFYKNLKESERSDPRVRSEFVKHYKGLKRKERDAAE